MVKKKLGSRNPESNLSESRNFGIKITFTIINKRNQWNVKFHNFKTLKFAKYKIGNAESNISVLAITFIILHSIWKPWIFANEKLRVPEYFENPKNSGLTKNNKKNLTK